MSCSFQETTGTENWQTRTLAVAPTQLVGELRCLVSPSQLLPKAALQLPYSCVLYATVAKKTQGRVSHLVIEVMHFLWANRFLLSEKQDCHVWTPAPSGLKMRCWVLCVRRLLNPWLQHFPANSETCFECGTFCVMASTHARCRKRRMETAKLERGTLACSKFVPVVQFFVESRSCYGTFLYSLPL